jgi:hypothetical protein
VTESAPRWRLLYTGSRLITDRGKVFADLDEILVAHPRLLVRHGACRRGGDALAVEWARLRKSQGIDVLLDPRPAPFGLLGKIAGPMRNAYMVGLGADECLCHLHPASSTSGALGCAAFAEWAGIPVVRRVAA